MNQKVKTIFLLRHGKSAWDQPALGDIKRELLPKGIQRTERITQYLREINIKIDKVISSPAKRAFGTAEIIQQSLNLPDIIVETRLYPCSEEEIFNILIEQDDSIDNVLIVGHNPGLTYFAREYMDQNIDHIPTSGLLSCRYYSNSWSEFSLAERKLNFVVSPKSLR